MRIVHLSSVHSRSDTRIFIKQCRSLAANGYDVTLVVADGKGDEHKDGVRIMDVGRLSGRLNRMITTTRRVLDRALALNADVYHLHDPELIPIGLKLKHSNKIVVFDSHEDVPKQLHGKPYLGPVSRRVLPKMMGLFEREACSRFNGIVAATPSIRDKFLTINTHTVDVNNFPLLGELDTSLPWADKAREVCYVGAIGANRGIREIVRAFEYLGSPARLNLGGNFSEPDLKQEVKAYRGWKSVNELGYLAREDVRKVLSRSVAGLVTLHPAINYLDALPVKMFEYMASGIPVIASNFPLWRDIVEHNGCGLCVDPLDPKAIAVAIDYLITHPDLARSMGENGRRLVLHQYNWSTEERKLLGFYAALA